MIDPQSRAVLQDLMLRESHSLLHYVCESFPWITSREQEALNRLQQINREDLHVMSNLARFLFKHHIVPAALGSYPMSYTTINYTALDHLVPLLIDAQKKRIGELQQGLPRITHAEARQHVEQLLATKNNHLQALEELAKSLATPGPAATATV
jgi:hypothetical protein